MCLVTVAKIGGCTYRLPAFLYKILNAWNFDFFKHKIGGPFEIFLKTCRVTYLGLDL
jgi:hypothetical protein